MDIVIPFAQIDAVNPNVARKHQGSSTNVYFECIVVAFSTIRNSNSEANLLLITNKPVPDPILLQLTKLRVEVKEIPYLFNPPDEFGEHFRGCFFLFDAISAAQSSTLFLDPDIVVLKNLSRVVELCENRIGVFPIHFEESKEINGNTHQQAMSIYNCFRQEIGLPTRSSSHGHLGGEVLFVPSEKIKLLKNRIQEFWFWNSEQAKNELPFLRTEEHILSCLLMDEKVQTLSTLISRIWTTKRYTGHEGSAVAIEKLAIWHLPSEKSYGFRSFYKKLQKRDFLLSMSEDEIFNFARHEMHVDIFSNKILSLFFSILSKFRNRMLGKSTTHKLRQTNHT